MTDQIPVKAIKTGSTATALGEFESGDQIPADYLQAALDQPSFKNRLINGDFSINQRSFAGGALAAGVYGFDRWKAGTGGCNVSLSAGVLTHTSGPLVQVIESPSIASKTVTVSVEDPSGTISIDVDGVAGTITAGSGRRGVSIVVPSGSTGNVTLKLTATGVTYKRVQLEVGANATAWEQRAPGAELRLCQRYYEMVGAPQLLGFAFSPTDLMTGGLFATPKRAAPAMTSLTTGLIIGNGALVGTASGIAGFSAAGPTPYGFTVDITPPSNLVQGYGYVYRSFSIAADAEL